MFHAPEKYLNSILTKFRIEKNISLLIQYFILNSDNNLHFIIDDKELKLGEILSDLSKFLKAVGTFNFKRGDKIISSFHPNAVYKIYALNTSIVLKDGLTTVTVKSLNRYIPLSNSKISQIGTIKNRIIDFKNNFKVENTTDFFCNEKLLVIANRNIFQTISKDIPACFVYESVNGIAEIEYNSPILPKITVLKNINLLDSYQQQEINGDQVTFSACILVGSSKFENSISIIRNYFNQRRFKKLVFIGEKDIKLNLGNNQIPLRWKWTIPEINFFKGERNIQHKSIIINNNELEDAITEFYQAVREIESKHTISLKSIYRFIRRIYYDWNLKQETTLIKLQQIQREFDIALRQLLIETLGNIFSDFDFDEYQKPLAAKFTAIIKAVRTNNKNEKLKTYQTQIHQLILPSFLCNTNKAELNEIARQSQHHVTVNSLQNITQLQNTASQHQNDPKRNFFSLTANGTKTEILPFSKSDDSNEELHKVISSIYGSGKVEKLIERLGRAKSEYKLLLYSIEEKAFKYHIESYISDLNKEYISQDRFQISGVKFSDNYYQFSNYDELIEALSSAKHDQRDVDNYKLIFNDRSKMKLPSTKAVLKIHGSEKYLVLVEDLNVGDKVLIYSNPDKKLLRDIMELKNPILRKEADELSILWKNSLNDTIKSSTNTSYSSQHLSELRLELDKEKDKIRTLSTDNPEFDIVVSKCISLSREIEEESKHCLYEKLVSNHFSVTETTFDKYCKGEVMFPRSFSDLIIIAKTINDPRLSFDFLKNTMKPKIEEYRGMEIEYGFKFSNSINHFIISGEEDEFISEWLTTAEIESIVSQIPVRTIKDIELITQNNDD